MNPTLDLPPRALERWQRLALGIRLAYNPQQPAVIRQYLGLGHRLVQCGALAPEAAWPTMLNLLLQTAHDDALPWFWRSVCLEHSSMPLVRASHHLQRRGDTAAPARLQARVTAAQAGLGATPGAAA